MKMSRSESGLLGAKKTHQLWITRYSENPKQCCHCQTELSYEKRHNKFCDNSCAASYNNKLKEGKKQNICICGKPANCKYCSNKCQGEDRWTKIKTKIEETGIAPAVGTAKRFLLEQCDVCKICGIKDWQGCKLVLVLDHINGNATDWRIENLRLICPNCDSQTETYKSKNRGKGRAFRRLRYSKGQSY